MEGIWVCLLSSCDHIHVYCFDSLHVVRFTYGLHRFLCCWSVLMLLLCGTVTCSCTLWTRALSEPLDLIFGTLSCLALTIDIDYLRRCLWFNLAVSSLMLFTSPVSASAHLGCCCPCHFTAQCSAPAWHRYLSGSLPNAVLHLSLPFPYAEPCQATLLVEHAAMLVI